MSKSNGAPPTVLELDLAGGVHIASVDLDGFGQTFIVFGLGWGGAGIAS